MSLERIDSVDFVAAYLKDEATRLDPQWTAPSGAKRSKKMPRYDLIPRAVLKCLADRLEMGAKKYGEGNWEKGLADAQWGKDLLNHMQHHLSSLANGDFKEDDEWGHLGAIMFGCMARAVALEKAAEKCQK